MCGIVGFWNRDGQVASEVLLEKMIDKINHRGPDDRGTWTRGPIGFGHARLSIIDLSSRGHQPFVTRDGQGVITYNGEVYNFAELRSELEREGVKFTSTTDTEVVLYALHNWGPEKAVSRFNGMFAFGYYDLRNQTLWLGRDRAGIKPLYVTRVGSLFAFGSEIKSLFGHPGVPCKPDLHALTTQILYERLDGSWTAFERVDSLLPGSLLKVTADSEDLIQYFDLIRDLDIGRIKDNSQKSFDVLVREFDGIFAESIKLHLISDAPLATMSSGGLDSSLMTAVAKEHKSDIVAYIADIPGLQIPEVPRARKVCKRLGVELRPVKVDYDDYLRLWPTVVYQNDQPNYYAQNVPFMAVAQAARRDGFKVLLSGEGSDELFGGYNWHVESYRMWHRRRLHSLFLPNIAPLRTLGRFISKLSPLDLNELSKRPFEHLSKWNQTKDLRELCAVDAGQRAMRAEEAFQKLEGVGSFAERAFLARAFDDFYCHLRNALISNDKMGMAQSIEARVPFLENALIDFGMHLPCSTKFFKGMTKRIVKKAAEKKLPYDIVHAKKIGFGVSHHAWKNTADFLKGGMVADFFKWSNGKFDHISKLIFSDHMMPFHLVGMEIWARIYFRGESPSKLGEQLLAMSRNGRNELVPSKEMEGGVR